MAFHYDIDEQRGVAVIRLHQRIHGEELLDISKTILRDTRWQSHMHQVWDARGVDQFVMLPEDVQTIVAFSQKHCTLSSGCTAIVAPRHEIYTIGVLLGVMLKSRPIRTFQVWDEALSWLGFSRNTVLDVAA